MSGSFGIATRTSYVAAILLALLMLGIPSFFTNGGVFGLAGNAAADGTDVPRNFTIAVSELTVDTLNPNTYTMVSEGLVIFPLYSYLLQYDVDQNVIGDAAREWSHSADGLLWNFKLWDNIYFIDPANEDNLSHQLTGTDVRWTFWNLQNRTDSRLYSYFPGILEAMWTSPGDPLDLWIQLNIPFASVQDSWIGMPILPMYYWQGQDFIEFLNSPPIGSGPYYYKADNDPDIGTVVLCRNDLWHATENFGWQMHTDNIILKEETSDDTALLAITNGEIDVWMRVSPSLFLNNLPGIEDVGRFSYTAGFVYEYNLNQMTDALREELGGGFVQANAYNNQQLILEPVRLAMAMCVDKPGFVSEVQYGLGKPACSLIPTDNVWHWEVPEEDTIPYNPVAARQILNDAGYVYDKYGDYNPGATPLSSSTDPDETNTLSFRFYTLDTAADWEYGSNFLAEAAWLAGVELDVEPHSVTFMNTIWYTGNYDVWLWDWDMGVLGDGAGIMEVLTSMSIGTSSDVYWVNETFDDIYTQALYCMDPALRHELVDQLQIMAYEQMGCQCVAYSANNYGVSTKNWNYQSLGDWNNTYMLLPDVNYQWLAMQMSPEVGDNQAPYFQMVTPDFETEVGASEDFVAVADDDGDNGLLYRWFWGDGEKTDWSSSGTAPHAYARDGVYDVWVAAREDGPSFGDFHDNFTASYKVTVTVRDNSNLAPTDLAFSWDLTDPDTGDVVTFSGSASDPNSDELFYTWDFGGGHLLGGEEVGFQFTTEGFHSVTMYVTDNHIGTGDRPVSTSHTIEVKPNYAPTLDVPTFTDIPAKQTLDYDVTASDPEESTLQFTWYWGDGGVSVTTSPTASHAYEVRGTYNLTVFADDLTGVDGHNVSKYNSVYVYNPQKNNDPVITAFVASDTTLYTGQEVSFTCQATDKDGDALTFTVAFGDGTYAVESFGPTDSNDVVSWTATYVYASAGSPTARLYVSDGLANTSSAGISITVTLNNLPTVECSNVYGDTGVPTTFAVVAEDWDGDTLSFTWDWDDGTTSTTSTNVTTHTYTVSDEYVYRVTVSDGKGESDDAASAYINAIPSVEDLIDFSYAEDLDYAFIANGDDPDGDDLTYTWDFGDGTIMVGRTVVHQYADPGVYTYTVYVNDGFYDGFPQPSHNVSADGVITIVENVPLPPEVQDLPERTETVNEVVTFTAMATDPNGDPITYEWDFGDSSPTEMGSQVVTHAYTAAADYTYSVTVSDGVLETTKSNTIHILEDAVPIADAGPDQDDVDQGELVTFDGSDSWDDVLPIASFEWTIPDEGVTLTGVSPTYTFSDAGVYTVTLNVTDSIGQYDTDDVVITVLDTTAPTAVAAATPDTVDMGGTVVFDGSGSTDNVDDAADMSYEWVFFDGVSTVTLSVMTPSYTFDVAGTFPVTLTVTDTAGNPGVDDTLTITVNDIVDPEAVAVVTPNPAEVGTEVTFNATTSTDNDEIGSWRWSIDLGASFVNLTDEVSYYTFTELGDFTVTLTVWDLALNSDMMTVTVTVEDTTAPVAIADADLTTITVGGTVAFDASGSSDLGGIASYAWDFGDDTTGTGVSATHVYSVVGEYTVTLTVTDMSGNFATDTVAITVEAEVVNVAPTAVASATPSSVVVGGTVTFSSTGSSDSDGTIASYEWTIMSGTTLVTTLTTATATYTFTAVGTYTVTLNVTDDGGLWDTASVTVTVTAEVVNEPPSADAIASDTSVVVGTVVEFSAADSSDDVAVETWTWTITDADGNLVETLNGEEVAFTFDEAGTYTVTLNVTDAEGLYDTDSVTITVTAEDVTPDEKSFIEKYGVYLGVLAAIIVVAIVAMMLLKKKKGGATGMEGATSEQPADEKL